jgi:hypothetical protein
MEYSHGQMEEDMKGNILMIKKKGMVTFIGQMVENTKADGKMVNSMELVYIHLQVEKQSRENGKMEKDFNGSTNKDEKYVSTYIFNNYFISF